MDCKLKTAGRDGTGTGILHRPPFDFVAVKRIHAYLAPRRPSRSLLRVQRFLRSCRDAAASSQKRETQVLVLLRKEDEKALEHARAKGRGSSMQIYAVSWSLCLSMAETIGDNSARLLGYRIHERPRTAAPPLASGKSPA